MKEENIFNKGDIVVSYKQWNGYATQIGAIFKVTRVDDGRIKSDDSNADGCQHISNTRHATYQEILAYNQGIRNIKDIKEQFTYYFY